MSAERDDGRPIVAQVADVVLYAPIGVALEARRILPEVVDRGRRQVQFAHAVGRLAVREGRRRVDGVVEGLVGRLRPPSQGAERTEDEPVAVDEAEPAPVAPLRSARLLAIPEYDSLSASQVIPRLESLDADELEAVRVYEAETRGRRTILGKVTQLQSA